MKKQILRLLEELEPLVKKEAQKEFKNKSEVKLYATMLEDITLYIKELKDS